MSDLTAGTPEGGAVVLSLALPADDRAAARTGQSGMFVDGTGTRAEAILDGLAHELSRRVHQAGSLIVRDGAKAPPGVDLGRKTKLGLPQIANTSDRILVEQSISDWTVRIVGPQAIEKAMQVEVLAEHILSQGAQARVRAGACVADQLEQGSVELDHLPLLAAQDEPRALS